ncbi:MAG: HNH endonuclease [Candidatus Lokiarchaeota archaeon]|nr:HNH endonuclease [Candidatus Lokiarchaeota archaeon]
MSISDKTRKLLWGRSGNLCAICKCELVQNSTKLDEESIVGDECHIVGKSLNGPRSDLNFPKSKLDEYDNLLLLCKKHHKIVDDQFNTYTVDRLKQIKRDHEKWIQEKLKIENPNKESDKLPYLLRIAKGKELLKIVGGAHAYEYDHDELENEEEVEIVSSFLQNAQDWGDILSKIESGQRIKISFELNREIEELESYGFWIFGGYEYRKYKFDGKLVDFRVAILRVIRNTNPSIIKINLENE